MDRPELDAVNRHLDAQQRELLTMVSGLDASGLQQPSRCDGWSVADVLLHLAQTNEAAVSSLSGTFAETTALTWLNEAEESTDGSPEIKDVDDLAEVMVTRERPDAPTESLRRWQASATAQIEAFDGTDPSARVPWVAGELAARTLASTRLSETWIHTNDIAVPLGLDSDPGDRLWPIARLVWRTMPYSFIRAGLDPPEDVALVLTSPGGDIWTFGDPENAPNVVQGQALELCEVAGQRRDAEHTSLVATGPQASEVLTLMRTFA